MQKISGNRHDSIASFQEIQRFRSLWLLAVVLIPVALVWVQTINRFIGNKPAPDDMPDVMLVIFFLAFGIGLPMLFIYAKLESEVHADSIHVRFFPFQLKFRKIEFSELQAATARTYRPILEYGGWGIRGVGANRAFNVSGNRGLQLEFKDGRRLLIGSQRAEEFASAIQAYARLK